MKMIKLSSLIVLSSVLFGCGLHQDPLKGKDSRFLDGLNAPTKPVLDRPVASDAIRVQAPEFVSLEEGKASQFQISARVLLEGYTAVVSLENLNEFPGATYDPSTGQVQWTPPKGYVPVGGDLIFERNLVVTVQAMKSGSAVLMGSKMIPLRVARGFLAPEITSASISDRAVREGQSTYVTIRVRDYDADANDRSTWSQIQFKAANSKLDLTSHLQLYDFRSRGNNDFDYIYVLDLVNTEVTPTYAVVQTFVMASSRYGKLSSQKDFSIGVYTSLTSPLATWNPPRFQVGVTTVYDFDVYDPKFEAQLRDLGTDRSPDQATFDCSSSSSSPTILHCRFSYTPTEDSRGKSDSMSLSVESRNQNASDTNRPVTKISLPYQVDL